MPLSYHATPMPLAVDENEDQISKSSEVFSEYATSRITVYFYIIAALYSGKLHVKPKMLLIKKHSPDMNTPLAKRLRAEMII